MDYHINSVSLTYLLLYNLLGGFELFWSPKKYIIKKLKWKIKYEGLHLKLSDIQNLSL